MSFSVDALLSNTSTINCLKILLGHYQVNQLVTYFAFLFQKLMEINWAPQQLKQIFF